MSERILQILKESDAFLQGHFLLSSGKHSDGYVQCEKVMRFPEKAAEIVKSIAEQIKDVDFDLIVGPAMGGIRVSYELGRQVGKETIFAERVEGEMTLRRGFTINPGAKIIIAEDVITTGKSTMEVKKLLEEWGGKVVGATCMIDRRSKADQEQFDLPLYAAISLEIATYDKEGCPLCKQNMELVKPGSRNIK